MRKLLALPLAAALAVVGLAAPAQAAPADRQHRLIETLQNLLPADHQERMAALERKLGVDDDLSDVARSVIDPSAYECAPTELSNWLNASIAGWSQDDLIGALIILIYDPVTYDALFFPEPAQDRFFGTDGEYTNSLQRTFRGLRGFWDIDSSDIELVPAHGDTLLDTARVARAVQASMGLTPEQAQEAAAAIRDLADQDVYDHGNAPIFTFNAFAFSAEGEEIPGVGVPTDKIVMGDGVLEGFKAIGLGDVAPSAILGHEFGHHVQYERNLFESPLTGPEATRRTELMADSFGAYFLAHKRGANLRWSRIKQFIATYANVGDCAFTDPGHHGTPNQRTRAAEWGTLLALLALPPRYRVLPSLTQAALFEKALPSLVRPDAPATVTLTRAEKKAGAV